MKKTGFFISLLLAVCLLVPVSLIAADGDLLWQADVEYTWSAPLVIGDYVYMQDQEGGISCFSASDGSQVWTTTLASDVYPVTSPTYQHGKIYATAGTKLYQVDATDGTVLNTFTASGNIVSMAPAVSSTMVYLSTSSTLYAVDISSFTAYWTQTVTSVAHVIISGDIIYALSDKLYCLDAADGTEKWSVSPPQGSKFNRGTLSGGYLAAFSAYDSTAGTTQLHAYLLSSDTSTAPILAWSADMGTTFSDTSQPASDGTYVYAVTREGVLRCFRLAGSGTAVWTRTVRDSGTASAIPAVIDGNVYIQDNDSAEALAVLVCLDGTDGSETWKTTMTGMQLSWGSPAVVDNTVYLATDHGGGLLAFDGGTISGNWHMAGDNPYLTGSDNSWIPAGSSCLDLLKVTGISITGDNTVNSSMTITATASNECGGIVYYRFGIIPDYGTASYDPANWIAISDYTTSNSASYTFTTAGSWIFTATVNSTASEPTGAKPMLGGCITIVDED